MSDKLLKYRNLTNGEWEGIHAAAIATEDGSNIITSDKIGILSDLNTSNKSSLVGAISELQSEVNTAQSSANAAQGTANGAQSAASAAQGTANGAQSAASAAQGTANSALTRANASLPKDGNEPMSGALTIKSNDAGVVLNAQDSGHVNEQIKITNFSGELQVQDLGVTGGWVKNLLRINRSTGAAWLVNNTVWTSGNDGAGSGLQADTVPGYGIGVNLQTLNIGNLNDLSLSTGRYYANQTSTPRPSGVVDGYLDIFKYNDSWVVQVLYDPRTNLSYQRSMASGTWGQWSECFNSGNAVKTRINGGVLEYNDGGTWKAVGGMKNVQRGTANMVASGNTNITISAVNMSKAVLSFDNLIPLSGSAFVTAQLTSSTNILITNGGGQTGTIAWQVAEYY